MDFTLKLFSYSEVKRVVEYFYEEAKQSGNFFKVPQAVGEQARQAQLDNASGGRIRSKTLRYLLVHRVKWK